MSHGDRPLTQCDLCVASSKNEVAPCPRLHALNLAMALNFLRRRNNSDIPGTGEQQRHNRNFWQGATERGALREQRQNLYGVVRYNATAAAIPHGDCFSATVWRKRGRSI